LEKSKKIIFSNLWRVEKSEIEMFLSLLKDFEKIIPKENLKNLEEGSNPC